MSYDYCASENEIIGLLDKNIAIYLRTYNQ
jgi:hypothetical protein